MSRNSQQKPRKPNAQTDRRAKKLAEALRANLKRRKAAGRPEDADTNGKSGKVED
jgi:hypothetical protein